MKQRSDIKMAFHDHGSEAPTGYVFTCTCGKLWMSRTGGLRRCNNCDRANYPVAEEAVDESMFTYECLCRRGWKSRNGGMKQCGYCGRQNAPRGGGKSLEAECDRQARSHVYQCGCGYKWMNRLGGLQKCYKCQRQSKPGNEHQIIYYSCGRCGNSWPSFSAGWKICKRCNHKVQSQIGDNVRGNNNEPKDDEEEKRNIRDKARSVDEEERRFEEEERRFEEEKRKFYAERRHFENWKMKQEQEYNAKMLRNEKDKLVQEEKLKRDEEFEENKRRFESVKRRIEEEDEETAETEHSGRNETGEELCPDNETETDGGKHENLEPETETMTRGSAEEMKEKRARNEAMEKNQEGNEHFEKGLYEEAVVDYTSAIELLPTDASFYNNRSAVYLRLNRFQEALSDTKRAVDLDPACIEAQKRFIYCLLNLGEGLLAERACEDMLVQYPDAPGIQSYLEEARDIYTMTEMIDEDTKRFSYTEALETLEEVVKRCPGCNDLRLRRAETLVQLRRYTEADNCLSELKRANDPGVYYVLGLSYYNKDKLTKAMECYKKALVYIPGDATIIKAHKITKKLDDLRRRADAHRVLREYQEAVDKYTEALSVDSTNHVTRRRLLYHKGLTCSLMNKFNEAISVLTEAIDHDKTFARSYAVRGSCYLKMKNYRAAVEDFKLAYGLDNLPETKRLLEDATKKFEEEERTNEKDRFAILGLEECASDASSVEINESEVYHPRGDYCDSGTDMMELD